MNLSNFSDLSSNPICYVKKLAKCARCRYKVPQIATESKKSYFELEYTGMVAYFLITIAILFAITSLALIFVLFYKTTLTYSDRTNISNSKMSFSILSKLYTLTALIYAVEMSTLWYFYYHKIELNVFNEFYIFCNLTTLSQVVFQFCHSFLYYTGSRKDMHENGFNRVGPGLLVLIFVSLFISYLVIIAVLMHSFKICLLMTIFNSLMVCGISLINLFLLKSAGDLLTKDLILKKIFRSRN